MGIISHNLILLCLFPPCLLMNQRYKHFLDIHRNLPLTAQFKLLNHEYEKIIIEIWYLVLKTMH